MRFRNPTRNGQSQPSAAPVIFGARPRFIYTEETLEHALL
jgi:hypothetical protein